MGVRTRHDTTSARCVPAVSGLGGGRPTARAASGPFPKKTINSASPLVRSGPQSVDCCPATQDCDHPPELVKDRSQEAAYWMCIQERRGRPGARAQGSPPVPPSPEFLNRNGNSSELRPVEDTAAKEQRGCATRSSYGSSHHSDPAPLIPFCLLHRSTGRARH